VIKHTHLNSLAVQLVNTLQCRGMDRQALLAEAGVDPALLEQADARLPCAQVDRLWQIAMRDSGNDLGIALDTAARYDLGNLHVLGFGLQACASLIEASERLSCAAAIFNSALAATCTVSDTSFAWTFAFQYPGSAPAKDVVTAATLLHVWRRLLRPGLAPLRVDFAQLERPADDTMHRRLEAYFGCPVHYRQRHSGMTLALEDAHQALPNANAQLAARGGAAVSAYLAELERSAIGQAVARCIGEGLVHKESVARRLNINPRTLQRRLQMAELSFGQLLAETRRELARTYLQSDQYAVKEVAFRLGYSDPANFSRGFRSWYGQSPEAFRQGERHSFCKRPI
jgi:AraC-like DNA-binding protein